MRLVKALTQEQLRPVYELYLDAFPEIERKPIPLIEEKVAEGTSEVFSIMDGDEFVGFAIFVVGEDKVLLDFFAVDPGKRCGGYGSKVFPLFFAQYPGKVFILEIEDPNAADVDKEELAIRRRRKNFYLRQGMISMPFIIDLFGVEMEVLTNGHQLDFPEYHGLIRGVYGPIIDQKILLVKYLDGPVPGEKSGQNAAKQETGSIEESVKDAKMTLDMISVDREKTENSGWEVCL